MNRILALVLRLAALGCLLAVLFGLPGRLATGPPRYAMVLDDSASVRESLPELLLQASRSWNRFEGGRHPVVAAGEHPRDAGTEPRTGRHTDLAAALEIAETLLGPAAEKRLLLVSDGLDDPERLRRTARLLRERRVKVFALNPPPTLPRAQAVSLVLPTRVFLWEPFPIRGTISATRPGPVAVELLRNSVAIEAQSVSVDASGLGSVSFTQEADRVGTASYALRVVDARTAAVAGEVRVAQAPRVRYLSDGVSGSQELITVLRDAGIEVRATHPDDLVSPAAELRDDDVVLLDDVPAAALNAGLLTALGGGVGREGKGLLVLGGRKGLGSESYRDSPLEALLPVSIGYSAPPPPAAVSLVIVLDTSFSMYFPGRSGDRNSGGPRKYEFANESAREVVRALRPGDRLGILGNSTDLFWITPLGEATDRRAVLERIDRVLPAGGGLNFYSAVREASEALRRDAAPIRHIIVFGDAEDIDEYEVAGQGHAFELIQGLAREGITLSILAIGRPQDKDVPFLRTATTLGKGDFYLVPNIRALPRYFVAEYRKLASRYYLEEENLTLTAEYLPLLAGIEGAFPPVSGFATVTPRKGSRTPLVTSGGLPLLTLGQYGRGKTAVFAGDNGSRWTQRWLSWPWARKFWIQLVLAVAPEERSSRASLSVLEADAARNRFTFTVFPERERFPSWDRLWLEDETTGARKPLVRTGLCSYETREPLPPPGSYTFRVKTGENEPEGIARAVVNVPPSLEDLPTPPDWQQIDDLVRETGGAWVAAADEMTRGAAAPTFDAGALRLLLIAGGLVLLLAETVIRYQPWR